MVALGPYLIQRLPNLTARPEYRLSTKQIRIAPTPERPVPPNLLDQVWRRSKLPRELELLDQELAANLAKAFAAHPWVARVVSVRKLYPAAVTVEVEYRRAVAMVQVKEGRIPIDIGGVVLPTEDFTSSDLKRYPVIQGIAPSGALRPGIAWKDSALLAAVRLAELLEPKWSELNLEAIVPAGRVNSRANASDTLLELKASGGTKIIWGRAPGNDHPGELTPAQKVSRLEKYLMEFGGFNRPNGPYEIDIRHWQEISRRPLVTSEAKLPGNGRTRR
jgi:hypothetical protein